MVRFGRFSDGGCLLQLGCNMKVREVYSVVLHVPYRQQIRSDAISPAKPASAFDAMGVVYRCALGATALIIECYWCGQCVHAGMLAPGCRGWRTVVHDHDQKVCTRIRIKRDTGQWSQSHSLLAYHIPIQRVVFFKKSTYDRGESIVIAAVSTNSYMFGP